MVHIGDEAEENYNWVRALRPKTGTRGRRDSRNVFDDPKQSKHVEIINQDVADLRWEVDDITTQLDNISHEVQELHELELVNTYMLVQNVQAPGAATINTVAGAWNTRTLNEITHDSDGILSLAANRVTAPSGVYTVRAIAPFYHNGGYYQLRLWDYGNGVTLLAGMPGRTPNGANAQAHAHLDGYLELSKETVMELQMYTTSVGVESTSVNYGENQIWCTLEILRIHDYE